jgi:hypothetical protein
MSTRIRPVAALSVAAVLLTMAGCETTQPVHTYQPSLSPLQACLKEVQDRHRSCRQLTLGAAFKGDGSYQKENQQCDDRKDAQTDRCYSRFGR